MLDRMKKFGKEKFTGGVLQVQIRSCIGSRVLWVWRARASTSAVSLRTMSWAMWQLAAVVAVGGTWLRYGGDGSLDLLELGDCECQRCVCVCVQHSVGLASHPLT